MRARISIPVSSSCACQYFLAAGLQSSSSAISSNLLSLLLILLHIGLVRLDVKRTAQDCKYYVLVIALCLSTRRPEGSKAYSKPPRLRTLQQHISTSRTSALLQHCSVYPHLQTVCNLPFRYSFVLCASFHCIYILWAAAWLTGLLIKTTNSGGRGGQGSWS